MDGTYENLEPGQCRFCLSEETENRLIAPCGCQGSARLVHPACLIRWQRSAPRNRNTARDTCEVCNVAWAVPLQPLDRLCWVRGLRTATLSTFEMHFDVPYQPEDTWMDGDSE